MLVYITQIEQGMLKIAGGNVMYPVDKKIYRQQQPMDEAYLSNGGVKEYYQKIMKYFHDMTIDQRNKLKGTCDRRMMEEGVTFTLYRQEDHAALERTIPFCPIPRVIPEQEWKVLEKGLIQRIRALNRFIWDIYHEQNIVKDGILSRKDVLSNCYFSLEMTKIRMAHDAYVAIAGIDLIRDSNGDYLVLEDNLRTPSGFSYLYKSRDLMMRQASDIFSKHPVRDLNSSFNSFIDVLKSLDPGQKSNPVIALLTPGRFNAAYYEHVYLAQQMGLELVEGQDLIHIDQKIYIKHTHGLKKVDVIYRRLDDDYIDPLCFRSDSLLGVPGLMSAFRAGNVMITNAPGTGIADDKAIYRFVPKFIKYYLNEEPILKNVPTYVMSNPEEREFVLQRLEQMVVKETSLSGGYGMLIGPTASEEEVELFRKKIINEPEKYIAQPTISLSTSPTIDNGQIVHRHIDLRAFVLSGGDRNVHVIPGGLTRVAMKEGSLVVNSSQGGGVKDTWVLNN